MSIRGPEGHRQLEATAPSAASPGTPAEEVTDWPFSGSAWEEFHNLRFGVRRSSRYHALRQRHYERVNAFIRIVCTAAGTVGVAAVLAKWSDESKIVLSSIVAVLGAFDLFVKTADRAKVHQDLQRRFALFEARMLRTTIAEHEVRELVAARRELEADEPPALRVLDMLCHNAEIVATDGDPSHTARIGPVRALVAHWFDLAPGRIKKRGPLALERKLDPS